MSISAENVIQKLNLQTLCLPSPNAEITDAYTGDLLSWVMGRAKAGQAWITIMTNINIVAVASLRDLPLVILAEGCIPDNAVIEKANQEGINLAVSQDSSFAVCKALASLLS